MAESTRRSRLRAATTQEIRDAARRQLRAVGPAGLSLRAVAGELGMSPAGLYRYHASRDDLLTALITDGFNELADAVEAARDAAPDRDARERLMVAAHAYRRWAVEHPQEFGLLYGTPVPGYAAPEDGPTSTASLRVGGAFFPLLTEIWGQDPPALPAAVPGLPVLLPGLPASATTLVMTVWAHLHGLVVLEVFGHLDWLGADPEMLFERAVRHLSDQVSPAPP